MRRDLASALALRPRYVALHDMELHEVRNAVEEFALFFEKCWGIGGSPDAAPGEVVVGWRDFFDMWSLLKHF